MMKSKFSYYIIFLSFVEGGAVMAAELLGAKMVAPYFGTSLQSWASILGVTLIALTIGYFMGGWLSKKKKDINLLFMVYWLAGAFLLFMPFTSQWVMSLLIEWPLALGLVSSLLVFLLPPILLMGMVSPMIIFHLTNSQEESGEKAGFIYAVSTFGGVLFTFLLGFVIIPHAGIKAPAIWYGFVMLLLTSIPLFKWLGNKVLILWLPLLFFTFFQLKQRDLKTYQNVSIKYKSEGLLGQIKVADVAQKLDEGVLNFRYLLVNNTWQTAVINQAPFFSLFEYVYYFVPIIQSLPKESKALVFGLGGGSLVKLFQQAGAQVKVVDIDKRLKEVAVKYFDLDPATPVVIDDARHYLNQQTEKQDVIVFDCFLGEAPPAHLLTREAFEKVKTLLNKNGILLIEFYGNTTGNAGKASKMLYNTLTRCGFFCRVLATHPEDESKNNFIYLASLAPFNVNKLAPITFDYSPKIIQWKDVVFGPEKFIEDESRQLTDDQPMLDFLLMKSVSNWRNMLNEKFAREMLKEDFPIFY